MSSSFRQQMMLHLRRMPLLAMVTPVPLAVLVVYNASSSPASEALDRTGALHFAGCALAVGFSQLLDDTTSDLDLTLPAQLRRVVGLRALLVLLIWLPAVALTLGVSLLYLEAESLPIGLFLVEFLAMVTVGVICATQVYMTRRPPRTYLGLVSALATSFILGAVFLFPWETKPWVDLRPEGLWNGDAPALAIIGLALLATAEQLHRPSLRWANLLDRIWWSRVVVWRG